MDLCKKAIDERDRYWQVSVNWPKINYITGNKLFILNWGI